MTPQQFHEDPGDERQVTWRDWLNVIVGILIAVVFIVAPIAYFAITGAPLMARLAEAVAPFLPGGQR